MLTRKPGDDLSMGYSESMHVMVNMDSHWSIPVDNNVEPYSQPELQSQPRGRRNVRGCGERGQPVHHNTPMGGANFGKDAMVGYFDQMSLSMN